MWKNSSVWQAFYTAWGLFSDCSLPGSWQPRGGSQSNSYAFNPLYAVPVCAAVCGIIAAVLGRFLSSFLPANGTALIFAAAIVISGEMRTSSRGLALNVTFFEQILNRRSFAEARALRQDDLKQSGVVLSSLLLAIILPVGKFFAVYLVARTGNFGMAAAAWVAAAGAEAVLAAEPSALNVPGFCRNSRAEYVAALAGFFLLFNLVHLPVAVLVSTAAAAVTVMVMLNLALRRTGAVDSNDMTMTGYLIELEVWLATAILIG